MTLSTISSAPAQTVARLNTAARSNLKDIDALRGAAALIVAAMHIREITWVGVRAFSRQEEGRTFPDAILGYMTFPLVWGLIGVPIFFVLSGYCIHRSQAIARARHGSFRLPVANFLTRRFVRIYPVLIGALLLTAACDWISWHYVPNSPKLGDDGFELFLVNLFSLQGVAGSVYGSNGALWTLSIEVHFYILYPLLLKLMSWLGNARALGALVILGAVSYFAFERRGYSVFSSYYVSWYLGVLVAEAEATGVFEEEMSSSRRRAALSGTSLVLACAGCALYFVSSYVAFQLWALAFALFLFVVRTRQTEFKGSLAAFLRWMGTFSFSLYIVHLPLAVLIYSVVFHSARQASLAPFYATLAAVIGGSYLFSLVFEKPALAWSKVIKGGKS
ncbi:MAG TPA: acyltransferase [Methylocystis sp.]|jgi:peptidoglycan/LPS O-acetylase OafA/YrhL